jgi:transposase InsO family protein
VIFAAIANWAKEKEFPVNFMCRQLEVTEAGYYMYLKRYPSCKVMRDAELEDMIRTLHKELQGNPGVRRIHKELIAKGINTSHKRVARLMRDAGLYGRHIRAWRQTTVSDGSGFDIPDRLRRNFSATEPNSCWAGDISYIRTSSGFKYLATVIDLYSRRIVGYALKDTMETDLVIAALKSALKTRGSISGVIFHHDRGVQYTSKAFRRYCKANNIMQSCGRVGSCFDNAVAESFFATLKKELIHTRPWQNLYDLSKGVILWIEHYYNTRRRHSYLGYLTPAEYELGYRSIYELAA